MAYRKWSNDHFWPSGHNLYRSDFILKPSIIYNYFSIDVSPSLHNLIWFLTIDEFYFSINKSDVNTSSWHQWVLWFKLAFLLFLWATFCSFWCLCLSFGCNNSLSVSFCVPLNLWLKTVLAVSPVMQTIEPAATETPRRVGSFWLGCVWTLFSVNIAAESELPGK